MTHTHVCICDNQWDCSVDTLPAPGLADLVQVVGRQSLRLLPRFDLRAQQQPQLEGLATLLMEFDPRAAIRYAGRSGVGVRSL